MLMLKSGQRISSSVIICHRLMLAGGTTASRHLFSSAYVLASTILDGPVPSRRCTLLRGWK